MIPGLGRFSGERIGYPLQYSWASFVAQLVENPPAMRSTWFRSLGWEDPLERGKATHPVFWPREFHGLYSPWGCKESDTTEQLSLLSTFTIYIQIYMYINIFVSQRRQWHPTPVLLPGKIPRAEEPGRLQSMGLLRVRHD